MRVLVGLILVLTGSFLAIIGMLGAVGAGLQLRLLPGRRVTTFDSVTPARVGERVVVRGTVTGGPAGTLTAPLSGRACVWYLAAQSAGEGSDRSTVERYAPAPFVLTDPVGRRLPVGPRCPALEQMAPSWRESREDGHPWFTEAPTASGEVEVLEFILTGGEDLLAAGDVTVEGGGVALSGEVALSAGGDPAALGDPAHGTWRRDLRLAFAGFVLIVAGSLVLAVSTHSTRPTDRKSVAALLNDRQIPVGPADQPSLRAASTAQ